MSPEDTVEENNPDQEIDLISDKNDKVESIHSSCSDNSDSDDSNDDETNSVVEVDNYHDHYKTFCLLEDINAMQIEDNGNPIPFFF